MISKDKYFYLLLLILGLVFWQWWVPGVKASQDLPFVSTESLKSLFNLPFVWSEYGSEGLGQYTVFTLWSWPLNLLSGSLAHLGLSFSVLTRVYLAIFLIVGSFSIWSFTKYLRLTPPAQFIASLLYLANTYILLVLDGGQLNIAIAYALIPAVFMYLDRALNGSLKDRIIAGLGVYLISVCDIRFIYLLGLLVLLRAIFRQISLKDLILTGGVIIIMLLGLHFYWLYPLIKSPLSPGVYSSLTESSVNTSLINLGHSLTLLAPHWHQNTFGVITNLKAEFYLIPILAILAIVFRRKDREVGFWILSVIIFVFLSKGSSEPLGQIYTIAYTHIPGFSLFRDSTKFLLVVALSYSVLLGITIDELLKRLRFIPSSRFVLPIFLTLTFLTVIHPVWLAGMRGTFSNLPFQDIHQMMLNSLETDKGFSRTLWIPSLPPLGYFSPNHPSIEASRIYNKRPFVGGVLGSYEKYNFLREAPYAGELLDIAGAGYISYPALDLRQPNLDTDSLNYYQIFLNQLGGLPWVEPTELPTLLMTKAHQDRFFMTENSWFMVGSDDIYQESTKSAQARLASNSIVFAEERPETALRLIEKPEVKILLNNKTTADLAASFIPASSLIFPTQHLTTAPDKSGWWKRETSDFLWWKDFLRTKYDLETSDFDLGGGWAVGEGNSKLKIQNSKFESGKILLARVMESSRSGELSFSQDDQLIGTLNTEGKAANLRWFEVGKLTNNQPLAVISIGDINVINALAILEADQWLNYQQQAQRLSNRVQTYPEPLSNSPQPQISYQMIDPTKYKIKVSGLDSPKTVVFSESYDSRWELNGQASYPVYSFLNGFWIEKDGEYIVEFRAQKYLNFGLIISGVTTLVIILILRKLSL